IVCAVVSLQPPAVAAGVDKRSACAPKKRCVAHRFKKVEHGIDLEDFEHPANGWNLNVVENQKAARLDVRGKIIILEVRNRITVRTIDQHQLKRMVEMERGQRCLSWAFNEGYTSGLKERRALGLRKTPSLIDCKDEMILREMREQQGCATDSCFGGMAEGL